LPRKNDIDDDEHDDRQHLEHEVDLLEHLRDGHEHRRVLEHALAVLEQQHRRLLVAVATQLLDRRQE
jgi:hypothetical protein